MPPKRLGRKRQKRGIKKEESYKIYIFRLLKLVQPNNTISSKAMSIMNSLVNDLFHRVAKEASLVAQRNGKATLSWREIQTAVRLLYPGELAIHACAEGVRAKGKFEIFTFWSISTFIGLERNKVQKSFVPKVIKSEFN